ncbi:unnamed protein product [Cuscuta epithymum]|uniref:Uncharacterized protein n=1 Tax=Cuscuta epithymum TaxID=186058 RepID=A0AAV0ELU5_9ASTE|nr:unnamed protein product [Cuscuta epithymum]CAH9124744.1 unnamed protein product [Cuscuta epithymum]
MSRKEEKRRKLHEALLKALYPPPSSPPHRQEERSGGAGCTHTESLDLDLVPDDFEKERSSSSSSSSSDEEGGCEAQKLTRAQRKRIRRTKLKEAASRRQKIIGPLLPNASVESGAENVQEHLPGVCQNAYPPETAQCTKKNKVKNRRMCKKLGCERSNSSKQ